MKCAVLRLPEATQRLRSCRRQDDPLPRSHLDSLRGLHLPSRGRCCSVPVLPEMVPAGMRLSPRIHCRSRI